MKVSSSYESVVGGVSQQTAKDRREGQHWEQVNCISDPVRGTARRHGSELVSELDIGPYVSGTFDALIDSSASMRTYTFLMDGVEYDLMYRTGLSLGAPASSTFYCVRKVDGVVMTVDFDGSTGIGLQLATAGVSALTAVGRFLYIAGNTTVPTVTNASLWNASGNLSKLVAWVRGGAYSRTYTLSLTKNDNTIVTVSYKTKSSGYGGTLDTSDIDAADTDYQKQVNDRVYAYQSAVTAWITESSEDILPNNIATKLADLLTTAGVTGVTVVEGNVCINNAAYVEIACGDGGDDTLIRGVGREVTAAELVSATHYVGKVVRVRPKKADQTDAYYLVAIAEDGISTGFTKVHWQEAAGVTSAVSNVFAMATIVGSTLYIRNDPAALTSASGVTTPDYQTSTVGDTLTNPIPNFVGKRIDYLGIFQDRLLVVCGSTVTASRSGDYLNFFRASVLTILADDPFETYALGSSGDTISSAVTFDRNLVMFGRQRQYTMDGRQVMTPLNALIVASSDFEDAIDAHPVSSGNYAFYCNSREGDRTAMFQVQIGRVADSPDAAPLSSQLDDYLVGTPIEMATTTKPNIVFLRTTGSRNTLYVYSYLDQVGAGQRLQDSWSKWNWSTNVGYQVGMSSFQGYLYVYMLKHAKNELGSDRMWFSIEKFSLSSDLSKKPYLDSLRLITGPDLAGSVSDAADNQDELFVAIGNTGEKRFIGTQLVNLDTFISAYPEAVGTSYAGVNFMSYTIPTNPFYRDRNGHAVMACRLTITKYLISLRDTGGCSISRTDKDGSVSVLYFNGRNLGSSSNLLGTQPIVTTTIGAVMGKEVRDFKYTIYSLKWLPLTFDGVEWVGQMFNNTRRI